MKTPLAVLTLVSFLLSSSFGPLPLARADEFRLPVPGVMVHLSPPLDPPILKGIKVHPDNPFRFDFILDKGESQLADQALKDESSKLIKYFLASLTIPENDLWVNLSPYEKDRIIPQSFGLTEMGRDLLAEDYMLKQITASLIYPEDEVGKKFWKRIYEEAQKKFGTTNIPVNTFNKVWIVPEKAVVYENAKAGTAYVVEAKLKVMLEQDYLALKKNQRQDPLQPTSALGSQIVREIVIPELTKEVNEDKNFSKLRQVYNSLILAAWYKKKIKDSILAQVFDDKQKVAGIGYNNTINIEAIYQRYLQAFKKGVYNYIKEDQDPITQQIIPRKYFSGGMELSFDTNKAMTIQSKLGRMPLQKGLLQVSLFVRASDYVDPAMLGNLVSKAIGFMGFSPAVNNPQVLTNQPESIEVPKGYHLIGGREDPDLSKSLKSAVGIGQVLIKEDVYSPVQDDHLTTRFLDTIVLYMQRMMDRSRFQSRPMRILDIGTGSGLGAMAAFHLAKQMGLQVHLDAVDITDDAIETARHNFALIEHEKKAGDEVNVFKIKDDGSLNELKSQYDLILFNGPDPVLNFDSKADEVSVDQNIFKKILEIINGRLLDKLGVALTGGFRKLIIGTGVIPEQLLWKPIEAGTLSEAGVFLGGKRDERQFFLMAHTNAAMTSNIRNSVQLYKNDQALKVAVKQKKVSLVSLAPLENELDQFDRQARSYPRIEHAASTYFEAKQRLGAHLVYTLFQAIDSVLKKINKGKVYYIYPFPGPDIIPNIFSPTSRINKHPEDFQKGVARMENLLGDIPGIGPILQKNHGIVDRESDAYLASDYNAAFSGSPDGKRVLIIKGFGWGDWERSPENLSLLQELLGRLSVGDKVLILDYKQRKAYEDLIKDSGFKEVPGFKKRYDLIGSTDRTNDVQDRTIWCDDKRLNLPNTFVLLEKTEEAALKQRSNVQPSEFVASSPVRLPVIREYDPDSGLQVAGLTSDFAMLSGQGFVMSPQTFFKGEDRMEPLIKESLSTFDFKNFEKPHNAVDINAPFDPKELISASLPNVTHLAIKISGSEIIVPVEFEPIRDIIQNIVDHVKANDPNFENRYIYLTVLHSDLQAGEAQVHAGKIPRVHSDGIQRGPEYTAPDYTYIASASDGEDNLGTVIYTHPFHLQDVERDYNTRNIDPNNRDYTLAMTEQAKSQEQIDGSYRLKEGTIALFNAYVVHQAPVAEVPANRVVVRLRIGSSDAFIGRSDTTPSPFDFKLFPLHKHFQTASANNRAMLSISEPQLKKDNVYANFMRSLVVDYSTKESQERLRLLHELGPQIEEIVQNELKNKTIKIAVIPRGSTLKGYAGKESDVEYTICILSGAGGLRTVLEPEQEHNIFKAVNDLIALKGYAPERFLEHNFIHISNYSDIDNIFFGFFLEVFAEEISYIFLPSVYGDNDLIDQVRKDILSGISKKKDALKRWAALKEYLKEKDAVSINAGLVEEKEHLRKFLMDNSIDPDSQKAIDDFNAKRQIPGLREMLKSYDLNQAMTVQLFDPTRMNYNPLTQELSIGIDKLKPLAFENGENNLIFDYQGKYAIRVSQEPQSNQKRPWESKVNSFRALSSPDIAISPAVYQWGYVNNDPRGYGFMVVDKIIGQSLDAMEVSMRKELGDVPLKDRTDMMTHVLGTMIKNDIFVSDSKPEQYMIGYSANDPNKTIKVWLVDAELAKLNENNSPSYLAGLYYHTFGKPPVAYKAVDVATVLDYLEPMLSADDRYLIDIRRESGIQENDIAFFHQGKVGSSDSAMLEKGGIDLTPANMHLQTQNAGEGIRFHLDPAMLAQLRNAPGFVPVIINIQPLKSLQQFLGLNQDAVNTS